MIEGSCKMRAKSLLLGFVSIVSVLVTRPAAAQSATAEALFQEGKSLMKTGKYDQACPKLEESYHQDPATGALLALAMCHEKQNKLATAWAEYLDVASRSKQEGRKDRAEAGRKAADRLQPQLSQLTLEVSFANTTIDGLEIKLDGVAVGRGAWGTAAPVDAGKHRIQATAPGRETWLATLEVGGDREKKTISVPELKPATQAKAAESNLPNAPVQAGLALQPTGSTSGTAPAQKTEGVSTLRMVGLIVGGVGVVGVGLGTYFGISAISGKSSTASACPADGCTTTDAYNKRQDAFKAGNLATIAFIAGGALLATGVTLYVVGGPKSSESPVQARLVPAVGPRDAGLLFAGQF